MVLKGKQEVGIKKGRSRERWRERGTWSGGKRRRER